MYFQAVDPWCDNVADACANIYAWCWAWLGKGIEGGGVLLVCFLESEKENCMSIAYNPSFGKQFAVANELMD